MRRMTFGDLFSVNIQRVACDLLVPDLIRAANFHEREYSKGQVHLTRHEAIVAQGNRFLHSRKNTLCKNTCNADRF